ncbi:hypothetical protein [Ottowia sp.]|uniref:hypothetical protein n=1 Tax=Ottowia sp. TaxID=1898956 RepID=UPI002BF7AC7C|nr:hypothetical protein [Ottowia sp.]HOB65823.1 hypothetical protein [Ottowia sp.]HPZ57132.1 hypothetical protein [Ottowia sp.]HQD46813.1 hypothetical protein [Ottowia sp.]
MTMHWMLRELARSAMREPRKSAFNPKPPGSMQTGSATYKALATLCEARGNWLSYGDILAGMGASKGRSIHWSLRLLTHRGYIEVANNDGRNPRYAMYRLTPAGREAKRP